MSDKRVDHQMSAADLEVVFQEDAEPWWANDWTPKLAMMHEAFLRSRYDQRPYGDIYTDLMIEFLLCRGTPSWYP